MEREFSAGGVVFKKYEIRNTGYEIKWLVAKSKPSKDYPNNIWRLPKGWIDDENGGKNPGPTALGKIKAKEEELQEAALREVREEGGVEAKILNKIATERFFYTSKEGERILKFVTFYLMQWKENLPEGPGFETEKVEWLEYKDARKLLSHSGEKKILDKAKEVLDNGLQENLI
jgi:8-oxo-dGTP pyrophosphatase MutT (NUDIX family)